MWFQKIYIFSGLVSSKVVSIGYFWPLTVREQQTPNSGSLITEFIKPNVQHKTTEFVIPPPALPLSNSKTYQHPSEHHPMSSIAVRWVLTIYRYYSRYFYQSAWLFRYYYSCLGQHCFTWLECILELFSKAISSKGSYSILLDFLEVSLVFNIVVNVSLDFLESKLYELHRLLSAALTAEQNLLQRPQDTLQSDS